MNNKDRPSISELIWLFVIGCFLGFVLETAWHFIKNGVWINKQGLLYGPFKPIYGTGLVLIILLMHNFKNKKLWQKFIFGVLLGSFFEYFCSLFQEYVFGTATWDYSKFNYNIGGRIYLPYCLAWGVIAIICIDVFYPTFKKLFLKISNKFRFVLTLILTIFMVINIVLTTIATFRYSDRSKNRGETNFVFKKVDEIYDDEYMQEKFPKLKIIEK